MGPGREKMKPTKTGWIQLAEMRREKMGMIPVKCKIHKLHGAKKQLLQCKPDHETKSHKNLIDYIGRIDYILTDMRHKYLPSFASENRRLSPPNQVRGPNDKTFFWIPKKSNQKYLKFPGHVILNLFQDLTKLDQWVRC